MCVCVGGGGGGVGIYCGFGWGLCVCVGGGGRRGWGYMVNVLGSLCEMFLGRWFCALNIGVVKQI